MAKYCSKKDGPALYLDCNECEGCINDYFFCLIVGSRSFKDYDRMKEITDYLLKKKDRIVIVSGGAKGADYLAKKYAEEKGFFYIEFPANWNKYGKSAGYKRNTEMHKFISKQKDRGVIAFWDGKSKGTAHNFDLAKEFKNDIKIINIGGN